MHARALSRTRAVPAAGLPPGHLAIAAVGDAAGGGHGVLRIRDAATETRHLLSCAQLEELAALAAGAASALRAHASGGKVVAISAGRRA